MQHIDSLTGVASSTPNLIFDTGTIFSGNNAAAKRVQLVRRAHSQHKRRCRRWAACVEAGLGRNCGVLRGAQVTIGGDSGRCGRRNAGGLKDGRSPARDPASSATLR
jgi:hypothetical protein